jgi:hypothetical protein
MKRKKSPKSGRKKPVAKRTTRTPASRVPDVRSKTHADVPIKTDVLYAYGFVRAGFDAAGAPGGLDDAPVIVSTGRQLGALISRLPAEQYAASQVEQSTGDVAWLSPRAMAHDRVLTWAQEHGGVIPLPMFSLWGSDAALAKTLASRGPELLRIFKKVEGADEFGVRVYRRDDVLLGGIDDLDTEIARLRQEASAAAPGQRYLLERKIADRGKQAVRAVSQRLAKQVFDDLAPLARNALSRPLVPESGRAPEATLVLNGAFLVDRTRSSEFRYAVGERVRDLQPRGLSFDFTGPWPPYNFVGSDKRATSKRAAR